MLPRLSYFVCTNPRSGSWLLCDALTSTEVAGDPREWFTDQEEATYRARPGIAEDPTAPYAGYLAHIHEVGTTPNGIFGCKLLYDEFQTLVARLARAEVSRAAAHSWLFDSCPNPRFIFLARRDKARQAISYHRVMWTDEWWRIEGQPLPKRPDRADHPPYDPEAIAWAESHLLSNDFKWQCYFHDIGVVPLTIFYEDLVAGYRDTVRRVLRWLEVPNADAVPIREPRFQKQADAVTEEWLVRYQEYKRRWRNAVIGKAGRAGAAPKSAASAAQAPGHAPKGMGALVVQAGFEGVFAVAPLGDAGSQGRTRSEQVEDRGIDRASAAETVPSSSEQPGPE